MNAWRWTVAALLALVGLTVLIAGNRMPPQQGAGRATRILYWEKWTGDEGVQLKSIVDAFNATVGKEKSIWVDVVTMSSIDQKTLVSTAAGVPPDIAGLWENQLVQFAAMEALEPIDDLMAEKGIPRSHYKPIYGALCEWNGKWWGMISTPSTPALHYNKAAFVEAGVDPENGYPRTLAELDALAEKLTVYETNAAGRKSLKRSGFLPTEPGWWTNVQGKWWGAEMYEDARGEGGKLSLNSPEMIASFDWIASYSRKYGKDAISEFRSGVGQHASAQNPFMAETCAMLLQGPWEANFIESYKPAMNRWKVPADLIAREKNFARLRKDMPLDEVSKLLGEGQRGADNALNYDAGLKEIRLTFTPASTLATFEMQFKPAAVRRPMTQWGACPFPTVLPGRDACGPAAADVLVIPRGSKHKREAFEFIAYLNRKDVMEKLCSMHCKNSPLADVSPEFIDRHPNPYIGVFEQVTRSPFSFYGPRLSMWPEVTDELNVVSQKVALLESTAEESLNQAQKRLEAKWAVRQQIGELREKTATKAGAQ